MSLKWFLIGVLIFRATGGEWGAIIGTNVPAKPLTTERIATLPAAEQGAWKKYLKVSQRQLEVDKAALFKELKQNKMKEALVPPHGRGAGSVPLRESVEWYGGAEAHRIADIVASFQTPAGGWSKNLDMTQHPRAPGEHFATDNSNRLPSAADYDAPRDVSWNYVGTFDNDATITQMRFLAKVIAAQEGSKATRYRASFIRGMDYVFAAQYPNGGWPQVWPLEGGYHDTITFNDDAMLNVLQLLSDAPAGTNEYAFVPKKTRARAAASVKRGLECVLATQIVAAGRRTVWCQQHDPLTLEPASARNYEMPSECAAESARLMQFLMRQSNPDARIVAVVRAAAAWFEETALHDIAFKFMGAEGRQRVVAPGAGPLWARYYEVGSDRPIFGDRDKTIHDDVNEISKERRNGYRWYNDDPQVALEQFAVWNKDRP